MKPFFAKVFCFSALLLLDKELFVFYDTDPLVFLLLRIRGMNHLSIFFRSTALDTSADRTRPVPEKDCLMSESLHNVSKRLFLLPNEVSVVKVCFHYRPRAGKIGFNTRYFFSSTVWMVKLISFRRSALWVYSLSLVFRWTVTGRVPTPDCFWIKRR